MGHAKAWLPFGTETLLQRISRIVGEAVDHVVVVAAPDQELPVLPVQIRLARDEVANQGPLAGLVAGFGALPVEVESVFVTSCDVPFLRPAWIRQVFALQLPHTICVPQVAGQFQTLSAVYPRDVLARARELLSKGRFGPRRLFEDFPLRIVSEAELMEIDPTMESVRNLNTREDYESALQEFNAAKG